MVLDPSPPPLYLPASTHSIEMLYIYMYIYTYNMTISNEWKQERQSTWKATTCQRQPIVLKTYDPPLYTEIACRKCCVYIHICIIYMSTWQAICVYMCQFVYICVIVLQWPVVHRDCLSYILCIHTYMYQISHTYDTQSMYTCASLCIHVL